jgi:hypothetical protein
VPLDIPSKLPSSTRERYSIKGKFPYTYTSQDNILFLTTKHIPQIDLCWIPFMQIFYTTLKNPKTAQLMLI